MTIFSRWAVQDVRPNWLAVLGRIVCHETYNAKWCPEDFWSQTLPVLEVTEGSKYLNALTGQITEGRETKVVW